jgi:hypothetical protein
LLDFLTLLDSLLLDVILAEVKKFAQFGPNKEERARRHGAGNLQEEQSGARIGVGVRGLLERDRKSEELSQSQQDEQCPGERTHW